MQTVEGSRSASSFPGLGCHEHFISLHTAFGKGCRQSLSDALLIALDMDGHGSLSTAPCGKCIQKFFTREFRPFPIRILRDTVPLGRINHSVAAVQCACDLPGVQPGKSTLTSPLHNTVLRSSQPKPNMYVEKMWNYDEWILLNTTNFPVTNQIRM